MDWVVQQLDIPLSAIPYAPQFHPVIKLYHLTTLLKYVPAILPSALYIEYNSRSQLQDGDIVAIRSVWGWQSYAMVSSMKGAGKMICFVNRNGKPVSDIEALFWKKGVNLGEVSTEKVLGMEFGPVAIIRQKNRDQALRKARSALGREWSFFRFNSEHFVTWAMTGEAKCQQLVNVKAMAQKGVMTGVVTGLATPEGVRITNKVISNIVKETGEEAASSVTKVAATHLMKETAEEAVSKTTAIGIGKKMASGAKAGLFGGTVVEGACLAYSVHGAYQQMQRDEISQEQFRHHVVKQTGAAGGSMTGGVAGAAIGSVIIPIPVVGTVVGSVVGGVVGSLVGSIVGEATDNAMFGPQ